LVQWGAAIVSSCVQTELGLSCSLYMQRPVASLPTELCKPHETALIKSIKMAKRTGVRTIFLEFSFILYQKVDWLWRGGGHTAAGEWWL